jgi:hypothetical protein
MIFNGVMSRTRSSGVCSYLVGSRASVRQRVRRRETLTIQLGEMISIRGGRLRLPNTREHRDVCASLGLLDDPYT